MSKGRYYVTCPECGANLDPGELCDCERESFQTFVDEVKKALDIKSPSELYFNENKKEK